MLLASLDIQATPDPLQHFREVLARAGDGVELRDLAQPGAVGDRLAQWTVAQSALLAAFTSSESPERLIETSPALAKKLGAQADRWVALVQTIRASNWEGRRFIATLPDQHLSLSGLELRVALASNGLPVKLVERWAGRGLLQHEAARDAVEEFRRFCDPITRGRLAGILDEQGFAPRLAAAQDVVTLRASAAEDAVRRPPPREKGVRLDSLLNYLYGPKGRAATAQIQAGVLAKGLQLVPGEDGVIGSELEVGPHGTGAAGAIASFVYDAGITPGDLHLVLPQALAHVLLPYATEHGTLDFARVGPQLEPWVRKFLQTHEQAIRRAPELSSPARRSIKCRYLASDEAARIGRSSRRPEVLDRMPVLDEVFAQLGGPNVLAGMELIAVQHLKANTEKLFGLLAEAGIRPEESRISGKPYSTDPDSFARLAGAGWSVAASSLSYESGKGVVASEDNMVFELERAQMIEQFGGKTIPPIEEPRTLAAIQQLMETFRWVDPETSTRRFLLLDDGGAITRALHDYFPEYTHLCVAVEQTEHGMQELEKIDLKCPVISVAQSWAKKCFESILIGESVVGAINSSLRDLGNLTIKPKRAAIIGYGAVGSAVAAQLEKQGYEVWVYDKDPAAMAQAEATKKYKVGTLEEVAKNGYLAVSCTGRRALEVDQLSALFPDGAVFANAASGNHELGMDQVPAYREERTDDPEEQLGRDGLRRSKFKGKSVNLGDFEALDEMFHRVLRRNGKEQLMLRSGYVVNMREGTRAEHIQLTLGLLLAACLKAPGITTPGVHHLDDQLQRFIVDRFERSLDVLNARPLIEPKWPAR